LATEIFQNCHKIHIHKSLKASLTAEKMNGKLHGGNCCSRIAVNMNDSTYVISWYNTHKAHFKKWEERK